MKVILLTQDDPFYLAETTDDFIKRIKDCGRHQLICAIVTKPSVFGKKENFLIKVKKTLKVFGISFFLHYSFLFLYRKFILRKSVIKSIKKNNIPIWKLETSINYCENVEKLNKLEPDVIVIIAGNQIIKKQVLDIPAYGVINAHTSLLPLYKGLMPSFWVLKNNENETGVSVYKLTEGIDDGPIILQRKIPIIENTTQADLIRQTKYLANDLLIESLEILNNKEKFIENVGGSYFNFPNKEDVNEFYKKGKRFF
jgi:methionyl-tRNA formyltransferase